MTEKTIRRCAAIDIHSRLQQVCYIQHDGCGVCAKLLERTVGSKELVAFFRKNIPPGTEVLVEATTNAFRVHDELTAAGYVVIVAESSTLVNLNRRDHIDDRIDAFGLARCLATNTYRSVYVPDRAVRARRNLLNLYCRADKDVTRIGNELWNLCCQHTDMLPDVAVRQKVSFYDGLVKGGNLPVESVRLVEHLTRSLEAAIGDKAFYQREMKRETLDDAEMLRLTTIPGVSFTTAYALMARIGTIDRFEAPEKLVAYIGVNPVLCESGEGSSPRRLSHYGHSYTKQLLTQSARVVLSRADTEISRWGRRLLAKGKHPNKVVSAVSRKMLHVVWHVLKGHPIPTREGEHMFRSKLQVSILPAFTKDELESRPEFQDVESSAYSAFAAALAERLFAEAPDWTPEQKAARSARAEARRLTRKARKSTGKKRAGKGQPAGKSASDAAHTTS